MFYIKGCILKSVDGVKLMALSEYGVRYIYTFFPIQTSKNKGNFRFYKSMSCVYSFHLLFYIPFILLTFHTFHYLGMFMLKTT